MPFIARIVGFANLELEPIPTPLTGGGGGLVAGDGGEILTRWISLSFISDFFHDVLLYFNLRVIAMF